MNVWETKEGYVLAERMAMASDAIRENTPTLRDQFAMNALNALLQKPMNSADETVRTAYDLADKMLEIRKEKK
jgi:hypothetical protein